jgi:acyl-CoA synthetase (AMP-forming)/AMP-acid ligase II
MSSSEVLGGIEEIESGLRWTGARLGSEIAARHALLSARGLGRRARIAIAHGGSADFFADLLSAWAIGGTAICLDPGLTPGELKTVVDFARPCCVLTGKSRNASVSVLSGIDVLDLGDEPAPAEASGRAGPESPDDPALVLFTSGTTGAPKGVVLSYRAIAYRTATNAKLIGEQRLARTLVTLATHFGHGLIGNSLTPLLAGGDLVMAPSGMTLARDLASIIDERGITFMSSVPALWKLVLRLSAPPTRGSLGRVHVGSSPLSAAVWQDIVDWSGAEVVNCYGMTETANWFAGCSSSELIADGVVGIPWGGQAAVANADGALVEKGEGELAVRGQSLMTEYLDRPDLTKLALRDGWYFTGDRGRIDPDGRIWITGRIKDEINRAGFKVQPEEIDRLLESHPGVAEACVFGIPDPVSGELVAAALKMKDGADRDVEVLRSWCSTHVRPEATPGRWFFVDQIPRTSRGKLNRAAVRQHLLANAESDRAAAAVE